MNSDRLNQAESSPRPAADNNHAAVLTDDRAPGTISLVAPTTHEEFSASRIYLQGIEGMAKGAAALFVMLGFELKRLHKFFGIRAGRPLESNSAAQCGIKSWAELIKRELGISETWARQAMAAAEANRDILPATDVEELLNTPFGQLPELRRSQILEDIKSKIQAPSVRQLLLDLEIVKPAFRGGDTSAFRKKLSSEQERELWLASCKADFAEVLMGLDRLQLKQLWKAPSIPDSHLEDAADLLAQMTRDFRAWIKLPHPRLNQNFQPEP